VPLDPSAALLTDRVAVVTGAAVGIGEAIAVTFANFGAHLAICDRDAANLDATADAIEASGRRVVAAEIDVRERDEVDGFLAVVREQFDHVDVLVNNAGGGFHAPFLDVNAKGQDSLVRENFVSVTHFIRGVVPLFPEAGGSILNLTSIEAHRAAPAYAVYAAQPHRVFGLSALLDQRLGAVVMFAEQAVTAGIALVVLLRPSLRAAPSDAVSSVAHLCHPPPRRRRRWAFASSAAARSPRSSSRSAR